MDQSDNNWHILNIDISNALRSDFKIEDFLIGAEFVKKNHCGVWGYNGNELTKMFTIEWLTYMKSMDLEVVSVLVFYRDAHLAYPEGHIDYIFGQEHPYVAINWVLGNDDSEMIWYKTPADVTDKPRKNTESNQGHEYVAWPLTELVEVERHRIGNIPTIVRVDVPHNIIVYDSARWSVSVRCRSQQLEKTNMYDWNAIVDKMRDYIDNNNTI